MKVLFATLFAAYVMVLSGCNTMEGIGEDVESAGDSVEDEAEENKDY